MARKSINYFSNSVKDAPMIILHGATNLDFLFPRKDAKIAKNTKTLRPLRLCERFEKSAIYALAEYILKNELINN